MQQFTVPTRDEVPASSQVQFDKLHGALGFVPNLYAVLGHSDGGLEKYLAFQGGRTSLNNKEKEAVNLVVSEVNGCSYCLSAHTAIGKMNGFSEQEIRDLRAAHSTNPRLQALVLLAQEVTARKGRVQPTTLAAFYAAGYTKAALVDVILQVADKTAMNYLHNLTEVPIDFPAAEPLVSIGG